MNNQSTAPCNLNGPCPSCGYCPHCGRGGYHAVPAPWPYYPMVPISPVYYPPYVGDPGPGMPGYYTVTCSTNSTITS